MRPQGYHITWPSAAAFGMAGSMTTRTGHRHGRNPQSVLLRLTAVTALLLPLGLGCSAPDTTPESDPAEEGIPDVAMPPAGGPKLVMTSDRIIVRDRPSHAGAPLGTLRLGATVVRAAEPYSRKKCAGGWYPIRPRGFVCAGQEASTDENHPARMAAGAGPQLDQALPYRYATVKRGAAVAYDLLPTAELQAATEPKRKRGKVANEPLQMGALDIPLNEQFLPTGPPVMMPDGIGVGEDGRRSRDAFFSFGDSEPTVEVGEGLLGGSETRVLKARSGVALSNAFALGGADDVRTFGMQPDGRVVPTDRLQPVLGTTWHGMPLGEAGLPVAFALRRGVSLYHLERGKATLQDDELDPRQAIALTGRFRTVNGIKYYFLTDYELWVRAKNVIVIPKRHKYPDFASGDQKWVDVSLANQTMVAWRGKTPLYATLISSGRDQLGDPAEGPSTKQGVFHLKSKHVSLTLDPREVEQRYAVGEAPWVLEFEEGFWITGCYWHSRFGEPRGFHNLAMAPVDAHWLWNWVDPQVPQGWHSVMIDEKDINTVVYVHR